MTHRFYARSATDSRTDQLVEIGRNTVIEAFVGAIEQAGEFVTAHEMMDLLGGMMVGIVQVAQSAMESSDRADSAIREMMTMNAARAVDFARAFEGKEPLPSA